MLGWDFQQWRKPAAGGKRGHSAVALAKSGHSINRVHTFPESGGNSDNILNSGHIWPFMAIFPPLAEIWPHMRVGGPVALQVGRLLCAWRQANDKYTSAQIGCHNLLQIIIFAKINQLIIL